jgi:hypothetical protein
VLSAVPTVNDLPATGNQSGDAHLVTATGNLHVWDGNGWTEIGHIQGPPGPGMLPDPWGDRGRIPDWSPDLAWRRGDVCFNDGEYWVIWHDSDSKVADPSLDEPTVENGGGDAWLHIDLPAVAKESVIVAGEGLGTLYALNAIIGASYPMAPAVWEASGVYVQGQAVRYRPGTSGLFSLYVATQMAGPGDVPGASPKWRHSYIGEGTLNGLTDVTAPAGTPPNSLLGTVGEGMTPGRAEWEPLHLDYVQQVVLGPIPSTVADLSQRITELEHTGEIVPPDLELTVDLYSGSFTRIIGCDPVTAAPPKRIRVTLATTPGPNGAVFTDLSGISGTGAVWADFGGTLGKVVDTSGTGINGAALKEAIRRGQIVTVHRGTDGSHPTLVVEQVENPADAGSSLTLDALKDVTAPANTPVGKVLGTTAVGEWGPVDAPGGLPSTGSPRPGGPWTYNGVGAATVAGEIKVNSATSVTTLRVNPLDSAGTDWSAQIDALQVGDIITLTAAGAPLDLRVRGAINTSGSRNIPVDAVSPSALTQGGTVRLEFPSSTPSASPGDILTLDGMLAPVWAPPSTAAVDEQVQRMFALQQVPPMWEAKNYFSGNVVCHPITAGQPNLTYWYAVSSTTAADVPGVSPKWVSLNFPGLQIRHMILESRVDGALTQAGADARYLGLGGGTLTGPLTVPAFPPPLDGNAIPKSYADSTYWHYWTGTQAQYDAIATKDAHTLYAITG